MDMENKIIYIEKEVD